MKILFVYSGLHSSHIGFAKAINADLWYYHYYFCNHNLPRIFKSLINGIFLPSHYDVYICEGGSPMIPVAIKKLISNNNKKFIHIVLVADPTFMMIKYTPKEMRKVYTRVVNYSHKITGKYVDGAIAISKFAKESIKEIFNIPVKVVYPYIVKERYLSLAKIKPNLDGTTIISIGDNRPSKGMDILINAFKIVKKEFNDAKLIIIGKGYDKWKHTLDISDINIVGYAKDLTPYFRLASLYVQASRADMFPVATIESLRAGVPAIVTEMTGTKEVIEKLNKKFIRKVDANDIAEGIMYYFDLPYSKKVKLSIKARKLSAIFNEEKMCKLFRDNFYSLLEEL